MAMVQSLWVSASKARRWFGLLLLILPIIGATLPSGAQVTVSALEQQLQAAVSQRNWPQALKIIDQLIPMVPQQASQLKQYRTQLAQLSQNSIATPPLQARVQQVPQGVVLFKRRQHGIPVVDVQFNQRQSFEMMVDSGASGTVITRAMASALGISSANIVGYLTASTANGQTKMPIVYVNAVTVGGLTKTQVPVAIAGPDMDMGLLGQDFLERYDVVLRSDRMEFHDRR